MSSEAVAGAVPAGRDWSAVRGFDYQPSYGSSGLEIWNRFDSTVIATELGRGRDLFPGINMIRIWLSWESFRRDPSRFLDNFDEELAIANDLGLLVMPVLFNRWHVQPDFGGVYIDHFLPGSLARTEGNMATYVDAVMGGHSHDRRILAWDLCNEPFFDSRAMASADWTSTAENDILPAEAGSAELSWLRGVRDRARAASPIQPLTIAAHGALPLQVVEEFSDVLSIHPYWVPPAGYGYPVPFPSRASFERLLDEQAAFAKSVGKPLVATECCLGNEDDSERVKIIEGTLESLAARDIGWVPHLLNHSLVADAFRSCYPGYTGLYMAFIEEDGTLRRGHDIFNGF